MNAKNCIKVMGTAVMAAVLVLGAGCSGKDNAESSEAAGSAVSTNAVSSNSQPNSDPTVQSGSSVLTSSTLTSSTGTAQSSKTSSSKIGGSVTGASSHSVSTAKVQKFNLDFSPFLKENSTFSGAMRAAVAEANSMAKEKEKQMNGKAFRVVINIPTNTYQVNVPISFSSSKNIEVDGNGSTIVNTSRGTTFNIKNANNVAFTDLSIDYDPLPFTQGVITKMDTAGKIVEVKIDKGYPSDAEFASLVTSGFFTVFDRGTQAPKVGARNFINPKSAEVASNGVLRVTLGWGGNEVGPGQVPFEIGDVVAIKPHMSVAISIENSANMAFSNFNLFASPSFGINQVGGYGATVLDHVNVVPGPKPSGAQYDRLCSTNSDGTHFNSQEKGPIVTNCNYKLTSDDPINIHNFYYFVVKKIDSKHYYVSPKWDTGLQAGDTIDTTAAGTFASKGRNKIVSLNKKQAYDLGTVINSVWKDKSPTTMGTMVYDITLEKAVDLAVGDAVSSLTRTGEGAVIKNSTFHGGGRVMIKAPDALVENNTFSYSGYVALHVGSDIGYWAEASFAQNVTIRNNTFKNCMVGSNSFFPSSDAFGAIYVGLTYPTVSSGLAENFENKNILIEGNTINDSYGYAMQIMNADGVLVRNNKIGKTFIRGESFAIGRKFFITPDSAVLVAMAKNVTLSGNTIATGKVAQKKVTVDITCDDSVKVQ